MNYLLMIMVVAVSVQLGSACFNTDASGNGQDDYDYGTGNETTEATTASATDVTCPSDFGDLVDDALAAYPDDLLRAAKDIRTKGTDKYEIRVQAIVSTCDFAYVNWYSHDSCLVERQVGDKYVMAWRNGNI